MAALCSWNSSAFRDPWWNQYPNGSIIYCNGDYSLDFSCNATFGADPDIAGPGVILGFVATAWYTIIIASIAATHDTIRWRRKRKQRLPSASALPVAPNFLPSASPSATARSPLDGRPRSERFAKLLLNSLCDLQLITGVAIVVAGLAQMSHISFYHEQFVVNYWTMTLNSFWAARGSYLSDRYHTAATSKSTSHKGLRVLVRVTAIIISCTLALVFQGLVLTRETHDWDFLQSGRCYRIGSQAGEGQTRFWIIGVSLYTLALTLYMLDTILRFIPATQKRIRSLSNKLTNVYNDFKEWMKRKHDSFKIQPPPSKSWMNGKLKTAARFSKLISIILLRAFFWLLTQFISVWSYGKGFYAVEILCYAGFAAWNTGDIMDLKVRNADLLEGSEMKWGFGQVLATALLGMVVFNTIDAFRESEMKPPKSSSSASSTCCEV